MSHHRQTGTLRILDANANRATEAVRVIEDFVRFVLDDRHLTTRLKQLRHDLTAVLADFPSTARHAARQTQRDVGTTVATDQEYRRIDARDVVAANFKRLEQALRSLEEFAKAVSPEVAVRLEPLRYRAYTLERAVDVTATSRERLENARLCVLIDGGATAEDFSTLATSLIEAEVHMLQLRDKQLGDRDLLARARLLRRLTLDCRTLMIVNDRPDVALLARADGVHVGEEDFSVKDARTVVGPDLLIGVSTHSIQQARQAVLDGANYIGVGPTFPSSTKPFDTFPGLELLRAVGREITLPAFAIGGVTSENLAQVFTAGCRRIAVTGAVISAQDPAQAARELLEKFPAGS